MQVATAVTTGQSEQVDFPLKSSAEAALCKLIGSKFQGHQLETQVLFEYQSLHVATLLLTYY